jgi:hypothetical protein
MSMIMEYARLGPADLAELRRLLAEDPDQAYEFADDLAPRGMDTDKAWAGLHQLLATLDPPVDVVGGGTPVTDEEWGYGSPRLLTPDEVRAASRFLDTTPFASLAAHYDAAEFSAAGVYPNIWDEDDALDYLANTYDRLVSFFRAAADEADHVLIWMS